MKPKYTKAEIISGNIFILCDSKAEDDLIMKWCHKNNIQRMCVEYDRIANVANTAYMISDSGRLVWVDRTFFPNSQMITVREFGLYDNDSIPSSVGLRYANIYPEPSFTCLIASTDTNRAIDDSVSKGMPPMLSESAFMSVFKNLLNTVAPVLKRDLDEDNVADFVATINILY